MFKITEDKNHLKGKTGEVFYRQCRTSEGVYFIKDKGNRIEKEVKIGRRKEKFYFYIAKYDNEYRATEETSGMCIKEMTAKTIAAAMKNISELSVDWYKRLSAFLNSNDIRIKRMELLKEQLTTNE